MLILPRQEFGLGFDEEQNRMNNIRIDNRKINDYLFYIFASFVFLKPAGIDTNGYHTINFAINLATMALILVLFVKQGHILKQGISLFLLAEIAFFLVWVFCLRINGNSVSGVVKLMINAVGIELLAEYTIRKGKLRTMINCFSIMYIVLLAVNLYLMIKNHGWDYGWNNAMYTSVSYLESDNGTNGYIMGSLLFALLFTRLKKKKITLVLAAVIVLCVLNEFRIWSASSVIGIILFLLYFLIGQSCRSLKQIALQGAIMLNIGVTFFRIQELFSFFFIKFLNKDATMTGRTNLWDRGIRAFMGSPIWGVGEVPYQLDNILIQPLTQGGLLLITAFILMIFAACRKTSHIDFNKNILYKDAFFVFCIVIILSIAEAWMNFKGFWIILSLFVNLKYEPETFSAGQRGYKKV